MQNNDNLFPWLEDDDITDPEGTIEDSDGILTFNDRFTIDQEQEAEDEEIYEDEDEDPDIGSDEERQLHHVFTSGDDDYEEFVLELDGEIED